MRRVFSIGVLFGALIWGSTGAAVPAAPTSASGKGAVARATSLLSGKSFTRFSETGSIAVPSSYDQRLHLCPGGRFVFDEVSYLPGISNRVSRTAGRWQVLSVSFKRGRAVARVRGVTANRAVVVTIAHDGRRTSIAGDLVIAARSVLCR
jgi:hypothetical protein